MPAVFLAILVIPSLHRSLNFTSESIYKSFSGANFAKVVFLICRFFSVSHISDPTVISQLAVIVQSHLTKAQSPTFGPVTLKLVEYGIARLRKHHQGEIIEPLAFLSVLRWLETQEDLNLDQNLRMRLGQQDSRGQAVEELTILYLLRAFRYPAALSSVFAFHGTAPSWADEETQIVARLNGEYVPVDVLGQSPQNPALGVVHYAGGVQEILDWIEGSPCSPAVLVSSHLFGPDIMIRFRDLLVMGQVKSYLTGNKDSLFAATMAEALTSLNSIHWFKTQVCKNDSLLSSLTPSKATGATTKTHRRYRKTSFASFCCCLPTFCQSQFKSEISPSSPFCTWSGHTCDNQTGSIQKRIHFT